LKNFTVPSVILNTPYLDYYQSYDSLLIKVLVFWV